MRHVRTLMACLVIIIVSFAPLTAQVVTLVVKNPSAAQRSHEPVSLAWSDLEKIVGLLPNDKVRLVDEQGRSIPFQIDDLDGDGKADEFAFQSTLGPGEAKTFLCTTLADTLASPRGPLRTDAANYKRIGGKSVPVDDDDGPGTLRSQGFYPFDGVGWESQVIAYRLYLDERNALDVQGKRLPGLQWNFIGSSGVDYQRDAYWGMDVLHVGSALGAGGFGFWINDTVSHPYTLDRRRTRIVARGPVRAVVRVDYIGWNVGNDIIDLTCTFIIYADDRFSETRMMLTRSRGPKTLAVGIVRHPPAPAIWNQEEAWLCTRGLQSRAGDGLMMALSLEQSSVMRKTEDKPNHLVLLKLEQGRQLRYGVSAAWQGENGVDWSEGMVREYLAGASLRMNAPLEVRIVKH